MYHCESTIDLQVTAHSVIISNKTTEYRKVTSLKFSLKLHMLSLMLCFYARSEIEMLEQDKEEILKDLRLIESESNKGRNERTIEDLGELGRQKGRIFLRRNIKLKIRYL